MSIDPDELKEDRLKRENKIHEIQRYMENQDQLDKINKTGKLGNHKVNIEVENRNHIVNKTLKAYGNIMI